MRLAAIVALYVAVVVPERIAYFVIIILSRKKYSSGVAKREQNSMRQSRKKSLTASPGADAKEDVGICMMMLPTTTISVLYAHLVLFLS